MPIENDKYYRHCVDENGALQSFEERFDKMVSWVQKKEPQISRIDAEEKIRAYMRTMPAWQNHPNLLER